MSGSRTEFKEDVLKEFPQIGKYRIRLVQSEKDDGTKRPPALDIREYVTPTEKSKFEGFTKRGIRISSAAQADNLKDILTELLANGQLT